jgi:hypothetical protein
MFNEGYNISKSKIRALLPLHRPGNTSDETEPFRESRLRLI